MKKLILLALAGTLILPSCMIEKRHYRNGFYVDFGKRTDSPDCAQTSEPSTAVVLSVVNEPKAIESPNAGEVPDNVKVANPTKGEQGSIQGNVKPDAHEVIMTQVNSTVTAPANSISHQTSDVPDPNFPGWAYILIALFIPPLAVALKYGVHKAFWLCLIFTLLGFLPGLIFALVFYALQGDNPEK